MDSVGDRIKLLQKESDRLKGYLSRLQPVDWSRPSACDAWEVRDVVAHLTGAVDIYASNISRGVRGDSFPPEGFPPTGEVGFAKRMEANVQRAVSLRESLGEGLLSTFSARSDSLNGLLAGLGPNDWDKPCYHPLATIPVRTYIDLRIMELAIHEWDIRSRLETLAHLSAECFPAIMDVIPTYVVVSRRFQPGPTLSKIVRYRFELTGTVPGWHDIVVAGGKIHMESAGTAPANVTFRCDTETFVLLAFGRTALDRAVSDGRIVVEGDLELAAQFA